MTANADDLSVLRREAERRGVSLAKLLGEAVAEKAAELERERPRPRGGVFDSGTSVGIAEEMERDPHALHRRPFRS